MRARKIKTIRALERGLEVLKILQESRAMNLHDLHRATGIAKATLTRILRTLNDAGVIWQRLADGAYLPSYRPSLDRRLDDTQRLVEVASPVLERLCRKVNWPSVLAVARLDHMEVVETNSPRSALSHIPLGPIGFRVNMLRSATGRAYVAFCSSHERAAILGRLRASPHPGNALAHDRRWVEAMIAQTRSAGYGARDPMFGGDFNRTRLGQDDGRNSIAVPILAGDVVFGCVNLTWTLKLASSVEIAARHLADLRAAAAEIAGGMGPMVEIAGNPHFTR